MKYEFPGLWLVDLSDQDPDGEDLSFKDLLEFNEVDPEFAEYVKEKHWYKPALPKKQ